MIRINGKWNGEPAIITPIKYRVEPVTEKPLYWQNPFIKLVRQGLIVEYSGSKFVIDNEHGDGYYKVTEGDGATWCKHKSVEINYDKIAYIKDEANVVKDMDEVAIRKEDNAWRVWAKSNHPDLYDEYKALRKAGENIKYTH